MKKLGSWTEQSTTVFDDGGKDVTLEPRDTPSGASSTVTFPSSDASVELADLASSQTFTNKTISGAANTITNIDLTASVTGALPIANGGTGQTGQTAAFDALSPSTTKGDLISHNGSDNVRFAVGTDGMLLAADSSQSSGLNWVAALANPMDSAGDIIIGGAAGAATKLDSGAANTVLYNATAGSLSFSATPTLTQLTLTDDLIVNTDVFFVDASLGRIGVNQPSPQVSAHFVGPDGQGTLPGLSTDSVLAIVNNTNAADSSVFNIVAGTSGTGAVWFGDAATASQGRIEYDNSDDSLKLYAGNTLAIRTAIDSSTPEVGIGTGTNTLLAALHVVGSDGQGITVPTGTMSSDMIALLINNAATSNAAVFQLVSGNAADASIYFGDDDSAIVGRIEYQHSTNHFDFITNGSRAVRIDSSQNVGIQTGTSTVQTSLHVVGPDGQGTYPSGTISSNTVASLVNNTNTTDNAGLALVAGTNAEAFISLGDSAQAQSGRITYHTTNNYLDFRTNATSVARLDSSGNFGLGTGTGTIEAKEHTIGPEGQGTLPTLSLSGLTKLLVNNGTAASDNLSMVYIAGTSGEVGFYAGDSGSASQGRFIYDNSDNSWRLHTAGTEAIRIDSSQNVGIQTTSNNIVAPLMVVGPDGYGTQPGHSSNITALFDNSGTSGEGPVVQFLSATNGVCSLFFGDSGAAGRGQINYSNSNDDMGFKVNGNTNNALLLQTDNKIAVDTTNWNTGGTAVGVTSTGGVASFTHTPSSARYKNSISDLSPEIDTSAIYNLTPKCFTYNVDGSRSFGYIAETVATVVPSLVNYTDSEPESVSYAHLSVLLLEEVKKLKTRIETLEGA